MQSSNRLTIYIVACFLFVQCGGKILPKAKENSNAFEEYILIGYVGLNLDVWDQVEEWGGECLPMAEKRIIESLRVNNIRFVLGDIELAMVELFVKKETADKAVGVLKSLKNMDDYNLHLLEEPVRTIKVPLADSQ